MNIQFYHDDLDYVLLKLKSGAGSFLFHFLNACLAADMDNYELLRPVLTQHIMIKYPKDLERSSP